MVRLQHCATLLTNGDVLITGGITGNDPHNVITAAAEVYGHIAGTFTATGSMTVARYGHTATLLRSGNVLVDGGITTGFTVQKSSEVYSAGTFTTTPTMMTIGRFFHQSTILPSDEVLTEGGQAPPGYGAITATAEIFSEASGWRTTSSMGTPRWFHVAVPLPNGTVMAVGGQATDDNVSGLASAEIYTHPDQTVVTETLDNRYTFQASIQFFRHTTPANDSVGLSPFGLGAFDKATRLVNRLSQSDMLELMGTMNLGIEASSPARNLAGLVDGMRWEDRGSVDVTFTIPNSETILLNSIAHVTASLKMQAPGRPLVTTPITAEVTT